MNPFLQVIGPSTVVHIAIILLEKTLRCERIFYIKMRTIMSVFIISAISSAIIVIMTLILFLSISDRYSNVRVALRLGQDALVRTNLERPQKMLVDGDGIDASMRRTFPFSSDDATAIAFFFIASCCATFHSRFSHSLNTFSDLSRKNTSLESTILWAHHS